MAFISTIEEALRQRLTVGRLVSQHAVEQLPPRSGVGPEQHE